MDVKMIAKLVAIALLVAQIDGQFLFGSFGCSTDFATLERSCPLNCDLASDTSACPVCVCPPCLICPDPCYVGSFSGGLHGECPGCAPRSLCQASGFFRDNGARRAAAR